MYSTVLCLAASDICRSQCSSVGCIRQNNSRLQIVHIRGRTWGRGITFATFASGLCRGVNNSVIELGGFY